MNVEKKKNKIFKQSSLAFALLFLLSACGKEREHKPLPKIEVMSKSLIDENREFLYIPSTGEVSRTTTMSRPYWQGKPRIVRLKFTEHNLTAYAVDKESRFSENETNQKIVFKIPIEHLEYRERTDAFGEGTNVEETNDYIPWNKRSHFRARPEQFKFTAIEELPLEFDKIFGGKSCTTEKAQEDLEFSVSEDGIDIVIRRDHVSSLNCESAIEELFDLAWSSETHYSLVPLDKLVSPEYQGEHYSRDWERKFGFFDHKENFFDAANAQTQTNEKYLMHRWNPKRGDIVYHLDPKFNKPENKTLKEATLEGIKRLNRGLEKAGAAIRIKAVDGDTKNFRPGNLRYSTIVMIEDPIASGLLGYGPTVTNPRTGEIVQARTIMYPGVMRKTIRRAYDELVEIEHAEKISGEHPALEHVKASFESPVFMAGIKSDWKEIKGPLDHLSLDSTLSAGMLGLSLGADSEEPPGSEMISPLVDLGQVSSLVKHETFSPESIFQRTKLSVQELFRASQDFEHNHDVKSFNLDQIDLVGAYAKNNMFPANQSFMDLKDSVLKEQVLSLGESKDWDDLSAEIQTQIIDLVLPYVWIPTLIHEVGHNLGLRHNFEGSEDKENFYTVDELKEEGVESDFGSPYSSMMEYSKSEITGLRIPGKYDVAALRFGYADNVELPNGEVVHKTETEPGAIKKYGYCSDEGVPLNAGCNRFDEGSTVSEIVDSMIDSYEKRYKSSYFRNDRANFSEFDDYMFASRTNSQFRAMRIAFERSADIMLAADVSVKDLQTDPGWAWLKDLNDASVKAARFFMSVIAEPDYTCLVKQEGRVKVFPMSLVPDFSDINTCSEAAEQYGFDLIGEMGKRLLAKKYRSNPNNLIDQIDVRGNWFNKILAMKYLMARTLYNTAFDENTFNYVDHPVIGKEVSDFVKNIIYGDVIAEVPVTFTNGQVDNVKYIHSFSDGYTIPRSLYGILNRTMRMPNHEFDLIEGLILVSKRNLDRGMESPSVNQLKQSLSVYDSVDEKDADSTVVPYILKDREFYVGDYNEVGKAILERMRLVNEVYPKIEKSRLVELANDLLQGKEFTIMDLTPEELEVIKDEATLSRYLTGLLPSEDYYFRVLRAM